MSERTSDDELETVAKKSKLNTDEMMIPAVTSNEQSMSHIFGLFYDCFERIFKWLSLKDLLNVRLTCKQLKEHADKYIQSNYPKFTFGYGKVIIDGDIEYFHSLDPECTKLIKKVTFSEISLEDEDIKCLKGILGQIDALEMEKGMIDGEFYENFFQFCPNVKHLTIRKIGGSKIIGSNNAWLHRSYPNLESVYFDDTNESFGNYYFYGRSNKDLLQLFRLNPNVRTFTTTYNYFRENWKCLIEHSVAFDLLTLKTPLSTGVLSDGICKAIEALHVHGVYKRLHLSNLGFKRKATFDLISTLPAIEALYLGNAKYVFDLSPKMTSLKEIGLIYCPGIKQSSRLAKRFANVERIFIQTAGPVDILPFIRYSAKVKTIYVGLLLDGTHYENNVVDLVALNKARKRLHGACKLTIYVEEKVFLATKWAAEPTKCSLIELNRAGATEWNPKF